ncbi:MAG TPA: hypothetical protein GXX19_09675 [Syntrophomonadaceae bacterium]|nr:hypothetical protein [Syntrophomonadaceae bacterium]
MAPARRSGPLPRAAAAGLPFGRGRAVNYEGACPPRLRDKPPGGQAPSLKP